ncbi:bifunctional hydroxymethylpyrimidine kinase/phosphomethylpyrimidine kinase [Microlunatus elymi]|uniref:Bifunctional hydroxymethylpyrimidine kinase/phosphomethylpyrimidine kinase n=2 Tax=Microlunatus elymi TaxID=2596828 RepID=A0A516Q5K2_9ACTN|nr:bifunctional hydroxymethylpyrimidine kinase/phosphomethylpyrimidine kinase [Microlunatus elymi]
MLSIAGSDPSGGAGIQADLKTATALGVYGAAAITSLTVQNTRGVTGIHPVPAGFVADQIVAVLTDLEVAAIKIGMLATAEIAAAVAEVLRARPGPAIVLDPVVIATSGDRLVTPEVTAVIKDELLTLATVITPNLPETGTLLDHEPPTTVAEMSLAAQELRTQGSAAALVKGGHLGRSETITDVLADADGVINFSGPYVPTANTHGTGCTLSSAIASELASGRRLRPAVEAAKNYLTGALRAGADRRIGSGSGPVDHLWREQSR